MVKLEILERLIGGCDPATFKEVAITALKLEGYSFPKLTDGWNDGGTDVRLAILPPSTSQLAVQLTVEKKGLITKIKKDIVKAKSKFGIIKMLLVTNSRIEETLFGKWQKDILQNHDCFLIKQDVQALASTFYHEGKSSLLFEILGIDVGSFKKGDHDKFFNAKMSASMSLMLFSDSATELSESVLESTIISILCTKDSPIPSTQLLSEIKELGFITEAVIDRDYQSCIDRLRPKKIIQGGPEAIEITKIIKKQFLSQELLQETEFTLLLKDICTTLNKFVSKNDVAECMVERLLGLFGGYIMASALKTKINLEYNYANNEQINSQVKDKIKKLNLYLGEIGVPPSNIDEALEQILKLVLNTSLSATLLTGELLVTIQNLNHRSLLSAFGTREITAVIDTSVAIPMLASHLFESTNSSMIEFSYTLYNTVKENAEIQIMLPEQYLEEVATHLLYAYRDYRDIVEIEPELASSENAFVSHFAGFSVDRDINFTTYLKAFGYSKRVTSLNIATRDGFITAREILIPYLKNLFSGMNIDIGTLRASSPEIKKNIETAVSYIINEKSLENRASILINHDVQTLCYLETFDQTNSHLNILVSWDKLHNYVREYLRTEWEIFDPITFLDLLSIAGNNINNTVSTPISFLKTISEESMKRSAIIWDALVKIETDGFHNAELIEKARTFKNEYLSRVTKKINTNNISEEWQKFKNKTH